MLNYRLTLFQAGLSMRSMRSAASAPSLSASNHQPAGQVFTTTGVYRGNTVAIRKIKKTHVTLTRENLLEMKVVRINYDSSMII